MRLYPINAEDGQDLQNIGNRDLRKGEQVWTDGKYIYGEARYDGGAPLLPVRLEIPYITSLDKINAARLTGTTRKITDIQQVRTGNTDPVFTLAVGKRDSWLVIGTDINDMTTSKIEAISLKGKHIEITENNMKVLDINVDYDDNLLVLYRVFKSDGVRIIATKNGNPYWSVFGKGASIAEGRVSKSGQVDAVYNEQLVTTTDLGYGELSDLFVPKSKSYFTVRTFDTHTSDGWLGGMVINGEFVSACDDSAQEALGHFKRNLHKIKTVRYENGKTGKVWGEIEKGFEPYADFDVNTVKMKKEHLSIIRTTYSPSGIIYKYHSEIDRYEIICTDENYEVNIEGSQLIISKNGAKFSPTLLSWGDGCWKEHEPPSNSEMKRTSYTLQIGETDKKEPIKVTVSCPYPDLSAGTYEINGETLNVWFGRATATSINGVRWVMTQSGLYRNGKLIDSSARDYHNACIQPTRKTNKMKKWRVVDTVNYR